MRILREKQFSRGYNRRHLIKAEEFSAFSPDHAHNLHFVMLI